MDLVDYFIVNEIEGKEISEAGSEDPAVIMDALMKKYPNASVVLTLGENGSVFFDKNKCIKQEAFSAKAVDTTAAGDTFCGYFLSELTRGSEIKKALMTASAASAIAVGRNGAAPSIPYKEEVEAFLEERGLN